ncbi:hypothetical protein FA10DRAFT_264866 [Acaromyces ingoldii]|uniref:Fe2OG dioxygenase domain-containing protein n=1 Tax=Acaromyces ingoldii TaxID=215250 RepID=A0A316YZW3_9BASI|nr:hypothetical protein FA10DRAFT_264866 [Acaromyces ingoldii]PWN94324.1 hypothetical protein FA10DRAFT_264866 [Acaromyces ingoldii]
MPDFLVKFPPVVRRTKFTGAFKGSQHGEPNHCLVNEYEPGQGIMPHEDGDAYFPAVATISLGSHTLLDIYRYASEDKAESESKGRAREQDPRFSILQERRSLLVTRGAAYKAFLHGIAERRQDTQEHLSKVINADRIKDAELKSALNGSSLERQKRLSLTLRDVERVSKGLAGLLGRRP